MTVQMTFGLYCPGSSPIHRIAPGFKLLGMAIAGMIVFWVNHLSAMVGMFMASVGLVAIARLPISTVVRQIRPALWIVISIAGVHGVFAHWETGVLLALRFLSLLLLATVVTLTTRTSDMVEVVSHVFQPLKRVGLNPEQLSLMVAIAIRFIPVLLTHIRDIQDAQRARGVDRPIITFLVPLLVRTLHTADALVDAIDARGFESQDTRD
jgi:biotin transport system permease protein